MRLISVSAKKEIFQDFELMVTHKDPLQAASANLHVAYAYASGFGVEQSFRKIVQKCANEGLQIAISVAKLINDPSWVLH